MMTGRTLYPSDTKETSCNSVVIQHNCTQSTELAASSLQVAVPGPSTSEVPDISSISVQIVETATLTELDFSFSDDDELPLPFHCTYDGCKKKFVKSKSLERHIKVVHNDKKLCQKCSSDLVEQFAPTQHTDKSGDVVCTKHIYRCSKCMMRFGIFIQEKKQHKKDTRTLFSCDKCNFCYYTIRDLNRHYRGHIDYECSHHGCAGLTFDSKALKEHSTAHKPNFLTCDICGRTFENKGNLREHVLSHMNAETREYFECPFISEGCTRKYLHKRNLRQHILHAHEGVTYECEECKKALSSKQKVRQHVLTMHKSNKKAVKPPRIVVMRPTMLHKMLGIRLCRIVGGNNPKKANASGRKNANNTKKKLNLKQEDGTLKADPDDCFNEEMQGYNAEKNMLEGKMFFDTPFIQILYK